MPEPARKTPPPDTAGRLLAWYDRHARILPWRVSPRSGREGVRADPYRVWLSEIMLQQTTVAAVKPYFERFVATWPDVASLATAGTDDVMRAWAGLGYYSRARNLKACAEIVASRHGGRFPDTEAELRTLPGIGAYTAAAIAAIAFGRPAAVVDGNIERVIARLTALAEPVASAKQKVRALVADITPSERPGDFAQAMMDLGATICTPRRPACVLCPLREDCAAFAAGAPEAYPVRVPRKPRPQRFGTAFVAVRDDGAVLLRRRPPSGLLGGMVEPPMSDWVEAENGALPVAPPPFAAEWHPSGTVTHVFTHFELKLEVRRADGLTMAAPEGWWWSPVHALHAEALPTVMKKAIESAYPGATKKRKETDA